MSGHLFNECVLRFVTPSQCPTQPKMRGGQRSQAAGRQCCARPPIASFVPTPLIAQITRSFITEQKRQCRAKVLTAVGREQNQSTSLRFPTLAVAERAANLENKVASAKSAAGTGQRARFPHLQPRKGESRARPTSLPRTEEHIACFRGESGEKRSQFWLLSGVLDKICRLF